MNKILSSTALAGAILLACSTASARDSSWSVTVGPYGTAISIGVPAPVYAPPAVYAPAVVYAPRIHYPPPVTYLAPPIRHSPPQQWAYPVVVPSYGHPYRVVGAQVIAPRWVHRGERRSHHRHSHHRHWDDD